ncbi:MAG: metal-sensitive transcriptional regulator [Chloroflexi bacterium]|nr:metal-sensitive transcriptional regulator [Chloroflexota bacterium]
MPKVREPALHQKHLALCLCGVEQPIQPRRLLRAVGLRDSEGELVSSSRSPRGPTHILGEGVALLLEACQDLILRLRKIEGQTQGIQRMLAGGCRLAAGRG